jgi:FtsH-binding integral membrane protein|tara:strand:+ start:68 stop:934 length:867 start_codon:yes stop_codon:yes gene_type:complete
MFIETPLIFKTVVILSIQLGLVLITCFYYLKKARIAYENGTTLLGYKFRGSVNMKRKLDLIPYTEPKKNFPKPMEKYIDNNTTLHKIAKNQDEVIELLKEGYKHAYWGDGSIGLLFFVWAGLLFATTFIVQFAGINIWLQLIFFSLASLTFGPLLAFIMLEMDENDGFTALKIVLVVTMLTGFIGYRDFISFSDSNIFGLMLLISLFGLLSFNIVRFFKEFSRQTIRMAAIFGSILFSLFLLYDFNLVKKKSMLAINNNWETAVEMAFILYLDVINLLLEILEAMGNS